MPSTTLTIDQLRLSPHNVRTNSEDKNNTAAMERSLLHRGQIMPLTVHPMRGTKGQWGAFAGGRRYLSFKRLIERNELPRDHPIDVVIRDLSDAELTELSLAENLVRLDLRPSEIFAAVVKATRRGATTEEIVEATGQSLTWVRQAMRLGTLAPPLLAALERDGISVDQARAFGATDDHAAQTAAWEALRGTGDAIGPNVTPAIIRAQLKVGDPELQRLLLFVGDDAYRAAGGRFELDLFAEQAEQRGRVTDEPVLRKLVDAKVGAMRESLRARVGRDVRFQAKPPMAGYGQPDHQLQVSALEIPSQDVPPDQWPIELPAGDVVGTIAIIGRGEAEVSWWWSSAAARNAGKRDDRASTTAAKRPTPRVTGGDALRHGDGDGYRRQVDALIKEEVGLTADGIQIMRSTRRAILRAALVQSAREGGRVAIDYLVWAQLRMHLSRAGRHGMAEGAAELGMQRLGAAEPDPVAAQPFIADSEAGRSWEAALAELRAQPFLTEPDLPTAFDLFQDASPAVRSLAEGVVCALALERSLDADGYRIPMHEAIAARVDLGRPAQLRHWWQPSAAFLDLLPVAERRAVAEPFLEPAAFAGWTRLKSAELTPLVLRVVQGSAPSTRMTMKLAAAQWVPPLLAFRPPEPKVTILTVEQLQQRNAASELADVGA